MDYSYLGEFAPYEIGHLNAEGADARSALWSFHSDPDRIHSTQCRLHSDEVLLVGKFEGEWSDKALLANDRLPPSDYSTWSFQGPTVSDVHVRIYSIPYDEDRSKPSMVFAEDLSDNGIEHNGMRMERNRAVLLGDGDKLRLSSRLTLVWNEGDDDKENREDFSSSEQMELAWMARSGVYEFSPVLLSSGLFGKVTFVTNALTRRQLTCKIVDMNLRNRQRRTERADVRKAKARCCREVDILMELSHPNVVRLEKVYYAQNVLYILQELAAGGDLKSYLQASGGRLPEAEVTAILKQVLEAVKHMHERDIIHGDINTESILLTSRGERPRAILAEFGSALALRPSAHRPLMRCASLSGTFGYQAPEVLKQGGAGTGRGRSKAGDMWSLGCLAYLMLTGAPPFSRQLETGQSIWTGVAVSSRARDFVQKLMVVREEKRSTVQEALDHPWLTSDEVKAGYGSIVGQWRPPVAAANRIQEILLAPGSRHRGELIAPQSTDAFKLDRTHWMQCERRSKRPQRRMIEVVYRYDKKAKTKRDQDILSKISTGGMWAVGREGSSDTSSELSSLPSSSGGGGSSRKRPRSADAPDEGEAGREGGAKRVKREEGGEDVEGVSSKASLSPSQQLLGELRKRVRGDDDDDALEHEGGSVSPSPKKRRRTDGDTDDLSSLEAADAGSRQPSSKSDALLQWLSAVAVGEPPEEPKIPDDTPSSPPPLAAAPSPATVDLLDALSKIAAGETLQQSSDDERPSRPPPAPSQVTEAMLEALSEILLDQPRSQEGRPLSPPTSSYSASVSSENSSEALLSLAPPGSAVPTSVLLSRQEQQPRRPSNSAPSSHENTTGTLSSSEDIRSLDASGHPGSQKIGSGSAIPISALLLPEDIPPHGSHQRPAIHERRDSSAISIAALLSPEGRSERPSNVAVGSTLSNETSSRPNIPGWAPSHKVRTPSPPASLPPLATAPGNPPDRDSVGEGHHRQPNQTSLPSLPPAPLPPVPLPIPPLPSVRGLLQTTPSLLPITSLLEFVPPPPPPPTAVSAREYSSTYVPDPFRVQAQSSGPYSPPILPPPRSPWPLPVPRAPPPPPPPLLPAWAQAQAQTQAQSQPQSGSSQSYRPDCNCIECRILRTPEFQADCPVCSDWAEGERAWERGRLWRNADGAEGADDGEAMDWTYS